ncbi:MAG: hypothetical protein BWY28_02776 [bacterium ADurb.Bin236]|nr:MAG: hypothetical protein BWY28_02776 [bacterium ADurb.Bin236]HOY61634.1 hypothetical protein [bacterium]
MASDRKRILVGERVELVEAARELNEQYRVASDVLNIATIESDLAKVDANRIMAQAKTIFDAKAKYERLMKRIREITDEVDDEDAPMPII